MRVLFYTLGCKVNQYETEAMKYQFAQAGFETAPYVPGEAVGDSVVVVNSCTVTALPCTPRFLMFAPSGSCPTEPYFCGGPASLTKTLPS